MTSILKHILASRFIRIIVSSLDLRFVGRSEYAVSTYNQPVHVPQVRRQHLVPYKPVYVIPQGYHYSLPRSNYTRVYRHPSNADSLYRHPSNAGSLYRHPSNAESYTLSRPPGRSQPIRIMPQQNQPIMTQDFDDLDATSILQEREYYRNSYSLPRSQPANFQTFPNDDIVIEAALEPPKEVPLVNTNRHSRSTRTHVKDIQYHSSKEVTTTNAVSGGGGGGRGEGAAMDGVEISPLHHGDDYHEADEWQEISLYMRRPSLEDVRRVRQEPTDNVPNQMRSNGVDTTNMNTANVHSYHADTMNTTTMTTTTNRRGRTHGQTIITNNNSMPNTGNSYVYRTTIPRDPQPRQKPLPMIMVNDEAMQF